MECNRIKFTLLAVGVMTAVVVVDGETSTAAYPVDDAPAVILAPPASASRPAGYAEVPSSTEQWLHLQAGGRAASTIPQQATARERELSYQRLLDSYGYPIPEFFDQDVSGEIGR